MKKALALVVFAVLLGAAPVAMAAGAGESQGHFTWGIGAGGAVPADGFSSLYSGAGYGLDGNVGYVVDPNLSFLLAIDSFIFNMTVSGYYSGEVNLVPSIKYGFGSSNTQFYLIGGPGLNENILNQDTGYGTVQLTQSNFMFEVGAGVQFPVSPKLDIYIQAKYADVLASSNFSYIPITAGVQFN